jgi:cytochrome c553
MICGARSASAFLFGVGVLAGASSGPAAETPPAGASSCSGCHAPAKAAATGIPAIEGRDPAALQALLEGFRSGTVPATLMNRIMLGFSAEEIAALAQWFGKKS